MAPDHPDAFYFQVSASQRLSVSAFPPSSCGPRSVVPFQLSAFSVSAFPQAPPPRVTEAAMVPPRRKANLLHFLAAIHPARAHDHATFHHGRHNCTVTSRSPGVLSGPPPPIRCPKIAIAHHAHRRNPL